MRLPIAGASIVLPDDPVKISDVRTDTADNDREMIKHTIGPAHEVGRVDANDPVWGSAWRNTGDDTATHCVALAAERAGAGRNRQRSRPSIAVFESTTVPFTRPCFVFT